YGPHLANLRHALFQQHHADGFKHQTDEQNQDQFNHKIKIDGGRSVAAVASALRADFGAPVLRSRYCGGWTAPTLQVLVADQFNATLLHLLPDPWADQRFELVFK